MVAMVAAADLCSAPRRGGCAGDARARKGGELDFLERGRAGPGVGAAPAAACCVPSFGRSSLRRRRLLVCRHKGHCYSGVRALVIPPVPHLHRDCAQRLLRPAELLPAGRRYDHMSAMSVINKVRRGPTHWGYTRPPRGAAPRRACQVYSVRCNAAVGLCCNVITGARPARHDRGLPLRLRRLARAGVRRQPA
jgi:hypothetical protein